MPSLSQRLVATDGRTTALAAALGAAIVFVTGTLLASRLNIWIDEAFTIHSTGHGAWDAWLQAITFEAQPPLYFILEATWRELNESSLSFARFPSIVFAAAAVVATVGAAHRIAPRVPPLLAALVCAFHPLIIWAAVEMRVYALVLLIGAVLTWTFFDGYLAPVPIRRSRLWYTIAAVCGLYTQYYVGFLLVAHAVTILAARRAYLRAYAVTMSVVTLAFVPFIPIAISHIEGKGGFVAPVSFIQAIHQIVNAVFSYILPHDITWSGTTKISGFALAVLLAIVLLVVSRPVVSNKSSRLVVLQWCITAAIFAVALRLSGAPLDVSSHFIVAAPLSLIVAFTLMASLTRQRVFGVTTAVVVFAAFATATFWTHYHPPLAKLGEWQRVAATLTANTSQTPIAVFPAELSLPLGWYVQAKISPIPRPMPFTIDYVAATTLKSESDVARVLVPLQTLSPNLWVVTSMQCPGFSVSNYDYNCQYLENYLHRNYRLRRSVVFRGAFARLFLRSSSTIDG